MAAHFVQAAPTLGHFAVDLEPTNNAANLPDELEIRLRISKMQSPIRTGFDADVRSYLNRFLTYGSKETASMLGRGMVYLPVIEHYLEMKGLPKQLKYLPMMESSLLIHAVSTKGAAGLWQLTPETARSLGLTIDEHLDERKDPHRSTEAAVKYLKKLHKKYGTWELALVAYNCGPGRLNKAILQAGCNEYQQVKLYLPKETQAYLARYLATAYVGEHFQYHQLVPELPDMALYNAVAAKVFGKLSLQRITNATGVNITILRRLNPALLKDEVPAKAAGIYLNLPKGAWEAYLNSLPGTATTRP